MSEGARGGPVVEPGWLWEHRHEPSVRIIDCGATLCGSSDAYDRVHLPEAVHLPVHGWLKETEFGRHVIGTDELSAIMTALGVTSRTTVVAYDDYNSTYATRLWWVLTYYGHSDVRVLNGGFRRWLAEGRPLSNRPAAAAPGEFHARPDSTLIADLERVAAAIDDPDVQILNVLTEDWYHGRVNPYGNARVGHIPGSVNLPIEQFLVSDDDPSFRPVEELRATVQAARIVPSKETIIHCQAGIRTTLAFLVLTMLGWEHVRAYDASMAEWANRQDTPLTC
jgi:thiosulfate/3-mercaptopyruvate sulfurtransferase